MIVVTHEIDFARQVSHRVVVMDGGVVIEQGPPDMFFTVPSHPRTRAFLSSVLKGASHARKPAS